MKTLILFSTRDGQTREIAAYIAAELKAQGMGSDLVDILQAEAPDRERYQCVIIGASVRYGHFHPALSRFIKKHAPTLNGMPGAFYSVNLTARKADKRTPQTNNYTRKFLQRCLWRPDHCAVFAGALRYPRYRWYDRMMIRLIMKMTGGETDTRKEVVYTDWRQVTLFAREVAQVAHNTRILYPD